MPARKGRLTIGGIARVRSFALRAWFVAVLACIVCACQPRGEPSEYAIRQAYEAATDKLNEKGGISLNMGSAGANQTITFQIRVHQLSKKSCSGGNRVYTCEVSVDLSYPPAKKEPESQDLSIVLFDGPGGWRVVE